MEIIEVTGYTTEEKGDCQATFGAEAVGQSSLNKDQFAIGKPAHNLLLGIRAKGVRNLDKKWPN